MLYEIRLGIVHVDLVDDRQDLQVVVQSQICIGKCLGLDALRRINDQDRSFTGSE